MRWDRRRFLGVVARMPLVVSASYAGVSVRVARAFGFQNAALTAHERACLVRISYLMFPHPEVGDGPYERTVEAVAGLALAQPELGSLVREGVASLDPSVDKPWIGLPESEQVEQLRRLESGRFFQWLYRLAIDHVYADERVWSHIGYEGSSLEHGGYLERGFDDIDWL